MPEAVHFDTNYGSMGDAPVADREGTCPFMRSFMNTADSYAGVAGVVLTTMCDQIRRAKDLLDLKSSMPTFLMNLPATWQTAHTHQLYFSELKRLGRFLASIGGEPPTRELLCNTMDKYDKARKLIRSLGGQLTGRQLLTTILKFHNTGRVSLQPANTPTTEKISVAFVGGPLSIQDCSLFDYVEEFGGRVALDATETGERTMPAPFDRGRLRDNPLMELTDAYFGTIPDVFRRPDSALYKWLQQEIRAREIRGVVLLRYVWCDLWHAESHRMKEWLDVPFLDIDMNEEHPEVRNRTRIQAFMESIA